MVMVIGSVRRWLARMGLVALLAGFNSMPAWAGGYWSGVARALPVSPLGNTVAVSCHNCYGNTDAATQAQVALALGREFDLIEFDLTLHTDGQVSIEHAGSQEAAARWRRRSPIPRCGAAIGCCSSRSRRTFVLQKRAMR